jgi:hypothetical protein
VKRRRFLQHCAATAGGLIVPGLVLPEIARPANVALHLSPQPGGGGGTPEGPTTSEIWFTVETTTSSELFLFNRGYAPAQWWDATIDWGDGSTTEATSNAEADWSHTYATAGEYVIKINGFAGAIHVANTVYGKKIKAVQASQYTGMYSLFTFMLNASNAIGAFPTFDFSGGQANAASAFFNTGFSGPMTDMDWSFASNFNTTWSGTGLTEFDSTQPFTATTYGGTWSNCASLETFAAGLFDNLTTIANNGFFNVFKSCILLTAQSVENILVSIAYACDNNGLVAPATGPDITIDYDTGTGSLSSATTTAIATCKTAGFTVTINGVAQ